jgi:response regulator RpfG family c-di-GMP phosphodiesterase
MDTNSLPRILCVDDERAVLDGLSLHLRRRHQVFTAQSGAEGLEILRREPAMAVVVSDMRMPGMNGATFLAQAREIAPDAVRLLLTGQADMDSAIAAINQGQIFRFLSKPCPPPMMMAAIEAALELNRLITAERVLLEQTLHGSIKAMTDILALSNPMAFGRATRIKQLVTELAGKLGAKDVWQVEVAAMLSQLGTMTLPAETAEKLYLGHLLSPEEQAMATRAPVVTEQLVRNIPRLDVVADILAAQARKRKSNDAVAGNERAAQIEFMAQLLRAAVDFDVLESQGSLGSLATDTMRSRLDRYEPRVVEALAELRGSEAPRVGIREVSLAVLTVGMVLVDDVKMQNGTLLVARGYEITPSFLERVRNLKPGTVKEPLRVVLRTAVKPGVQAAGGGKP